VASQFRSCCTLLVRNYATFQIQPYKYAHHTYYKHKVMLCIQAVVTSVIPALQSISHIKYKNICPKSILPQFEARFGENKSPIHYSYKNDFQTALGRCNSPVIPQFTTLTRMTFKLYKVQFSSHSTSPLDCNPVSQFIVRKPRIDMLADRSKAQLKTLQWLTLPWVIHIFIKVLK